MKQVDNRRLVNLKTRQETGFDYVVSGVEPGTPFGRKAQKDAGPFFPGQEKELVSELRKIGELKDFAASSPSKVRLLQEVFMSCKDVSGTVERSRSDVLSVVDIYEIKQALLNDAAVRRILASSDEEIKGAAARAAGGENCCCDENANVAKRLGTDEKTEAVFPSTIDPEFIPLDTSDLLDLLDPRGDRLPTFYVYDDFSADLAAVRAEKKELEKSLRRLQKARAARLKSDLGIVLTPKFDVVIPKSSRMLAMAKECSDLAVSLEDYSSVTFVLAPDDETFDLIRQSEELEVRIEEEEYKVLKDLSSRIGSGSDAILENFRRIGRLDFVLAKALYAEKNACVMPEIVPEHRISIKEGRHLQVEEILRRKGGEYCPISIDLERGVTCITGANMGGKTVSLKLTGMIPLLAQYGYFVPAERAEIGLSNFVQMLIGDSQSVERGLSSFGSEMEELKEILDHAGDRSLILIDEIASGTNPGEGLALTRSLVDYLMERDYIALITTHFETVTEREGVVNMQVRGLADADFRKLDSELRYANRRERISIIGKYMDYRLTRVSGESKVPHDALNIAKMLGIDKEIIEGAGKYLEQ